MSRYQKGKTNLDLTEARNSEMQWHQLGLGRMQVCTLLQTDNHTSTSPFVNMYRIMYKEHNKSKKTSTTKTHIL